MAAQIWPRAGFYRGLFRLKGTIQSDINAQDFQRRNFCCGWYNALDYCTFSSAFEIIYKTLDERHLKKTLSEFHDIICASNFEYCDSIGLGTMAVGSIDSSVYYDFYEEYSPITEDPHVNQKLSKNNYTILAGIRQILRVSKFRR